MATLSDLRKSPLSWASVQMLRRMRPYNKYLKCLDGRRDVIAAVRLCAENDIAV